VGFPIACMVHDPKRSLTAGCRTDAVALVLLVAAWK